MKMRGKVFAVIIFTIFLIAVCVFEASVTFEAVNKVKSSNNNVIKLAYENSKSNEQLYSILNEMDKSWTENENYLCIIFNHKDMVEIGKEIEQAKSYLKLNNKAEAIVHLELLAENIISLEHILYFNLQNLF